MFEEAELRPKLNKLVYETYTDCIVGQLNSLATFNMRNNLGGQDIPYIIFFRMLSDISLILTHMSKGKSYCLVIAKLCSNLQQFPDTSINSLICTSAFGALFCL